MSAAASGISCVAMQSPVWPPGAPNGIVTYTAVMKRAFEAAGARTVVVVPNVGQDGPEAVYSGNPMSVAEELTRKARLRLVRGATGVGEGLIACVKRLRKSAGVQVLEAEETCGWCGEVARASGVPVVARLHGPWFLNGPALGVARDAEFEDRLEREKRAIETCQGVTSPSRDVLERTREFYGLALAHAEAIPCPIEAGPEAERWHPDRCERELVLFVGRFDRHKGGDVMLNAFAMVAAKRARARLVFAGPDRGLVGDDGRQWTMDEYLERLPLSVRERIEWPGPCPPEKVAARLRRRAAVTVVCSRYENFGYTVLEGLAGASPMVVSRTGGLVEMVEDGRSALLCEPGDPASVATQVERLLDDPGLAAGLAEKGLQNVVERFSPAAVAERTLRYYRGVLGRA